MNCAFLTPTSFATKPWPSLLCWLSLTLLTLGYSSPVQAYDHAYQFRFIGGEIIPLSKNLEEIATDPVLGFELSYEFLPTGLQPWHYYWGMPTFGLGLQVLDLGNQDLLGQAISFYPYMLISVAHNKKYALEYKFGGGMAYLTKTWEDGDTEHGVDAPTANAAIGSNLNVFLTTGFKLDYHITPTWDLSTELGYNHYSNGSIIQPNGGINLLYGSVGLRYIFKDCVSCKPGPSPYPATPYDLSFNVSAEAGSRQLYYKDQKNYFVGVLHLGVTKTLKPWYGLGLGADFMIDNAFNRQGTRPGMTSEEITIQQQNTLFNRYYVTNDDFSNKFRVGVCLSNEFIIGRFTGLLDLGVYAYDGMRNNYTTPHPTYNDDRPLIYSYDIDDEDGWNYFRIGGRYRVINNFYIQGLVKTHLQKAEYVTFGISYLIPFRKEGGSILGPKLGGYSYHWMNLGKQTQRRRPSFSQKEPYIEREKYKQKHVKKFRRQQLKRLKKELKAEKKVSLHHKQMDGGSSQGTSTTKKKSWFNWLKRPAWTKRSK